MKTLSLPLVFLLLPYFSSAQAPKNTSARKTDECKISGVVVKLAGSEPLKNARVQAVSQDDRPESHSTATEAGGRFDRRGLNPGRYRLVVRRDGFVTQTYGQKKPDDPGAILTLRAKQEVKEARRSACKTATRKRSTSPLFKPNARKRSLRIPHQIEKN
jgi:hypothetical protein